jgi:hypothetical protein
MRDAALSLKVGDSISEGLGAIFVRSSLFRDLGALFTIVPSKTLAARLELSLRTTFGGYEACEISKKFNVHYYKIEGMYMFRKLSVFSPAVQWVLPLKPAFYRKAVYPISRTPTTT